MQSITFIMVIAILESIKVDLWIRFCSPHVTSGSTRSARPKAPEYTVLFSTKNTHMKK